MKHNQYAIQLIETQQAIEHMKKTIVELQDKQLAVLSRWYEEHGTDLPIEDKVMITHDSQLWVISLGHPDDKPEVERATAYFIQEDGSMI